MRPLTAENLTSASLVSLFELPRGGSGEIVGLDASGDEASREICHRLAELGFLKGERVRVIARGLTGGEPVAVRIGTATFALRRFEAERIRVQPFSSL